MLKNSDHTMSDNAPGLNLTTKFEGENLEAPSTARVSHLIRFFLVLIHSIDYNLHESIFDIVWFGEGRWSWQDLYDDASFFTKILGKAYYRNQSKNRQDDSVKKQQHQHKSNKSKVPTKRRR